MLYSAKRMDGWELAARDGELGHAREVYFDDRRWVIRHVVADTGGWLSGRKVLLSPHAIQRLDPAAGLIELALTKQQVEDAPDIDTDKPVSRQQEASYYDYYGYPYYWAGAGLWGVGGYPLLAGAMPLPVGPGPDRDASPAQAEGQAHAQAQAQAERENEDPHLRSSSEVTGYHIEATDGSIGHIEDFLFDDRSWQIRYVVVDTRNWLPGRRVLVSPHWITEIDWSGQRVKVKVPREAVRESPAYEAHAHLPEEEVQKVQRHYEGWQ